MSGWFHGTYWTLPLTSPYTAIPIAALESIAALTSVVSFVSLSRSSMNLLRTLPLSCMTMHVRVNVLSTPFILTDDSASSPMMVALHSFMLTHPAFALWSPSLVVSHVPGVGNEFSDHDAASRNEISRLHCMADHLHASPSLIDPHPVYHDLLDIVLNSL